MATTTAPAAPTVVDNAPAAPTVVDNALATLTTHAALLTTATTLLQSLTSHFASLSASLAARSSSLAASTLSHSADLTSSLAAISLRDASLPDLESSAAARVHELKLSALAHLSDPDAKLPSDLPSVLAAYALRMDSANLWRFILSRRRDLSALRKEVPAAVSAAVDPPRLVLDAVADFLDQPEGEGGDRYWVLEMLLRAVFVDAEGRKPPEVSGGIRERARAVAEAVKGKLDKEAAAVDGVGVGGPEAHVFLQLVAAFGLSDGFEEGFLRKLVVEHASRKEIWKIVGGLGFGEKMADIIDELVKNGKVIEAVYFAHGSGLTERFPSIPLIQSYYQSSKRSATNILKNGNRSTAATEESSTLELNAIRSIMDCVEILKLEGEYPLDGLRKRLNILEKAKSERRKTATKYENKRSRYSGTGSGSRPAKAGRTANVPYASFRRNGPAAHQTPPARHSYKYPSQIQRTATPYGGGVSISYGGYDYAAPLSAPAQAAYPHQL